MDSNYSKERLEQMKNVDIRKVNPADLVDLTRVSIDESLPVSQRVASFISQVQNPYCFRIGDVAVKVEYKANGPTFQQNMEDLFRTL